MSSHYLYLTLYQSLLQNLSWKPLLSTQNLDNFSLVTKAELLRLGWHSSHSDRSKHEPAKQLADICTPEWVGSADLAEVCTVIVALQTHEPDVVSVQHVAAFLKRLIAAETAPGGPYADTQGQISPLLNASITTVTAQLAAPMSKAAAAAQSISGIGNVAAEDYALYAWLSSRAIPAQEADLLCMALANALLSGRTPEPAPLANEIYWHCRRLLKQLPKPLRHCSLEVLEATIGTDNHHEISLLAYRAAGDDSTNHDIIACGTANIMAWIAYTIYDDFLDDEGDPRLLSAAHQAYRAMWQQYASLGLGEDFEAFVAQTLITVDNANTRELLAHRFEISDKIITINAIPEFGQLEMLADRALFHIIGPMALFAKQGMKVGSRSWQTKLEGFRHYLIAKQLNDDIHDWRKDFTAGHITYVVAEILRHFRLNPGVYDKLSLLPRMQQAFWQEVLPPICDLVICHAEASLATLGPTKDGELYGFISRLKQEMLAAKKKVSDNEALARLFAS